MASILKHLRSSTADKRPTASGLADGQIAINTASGSPGVFFKDSNSNVVKVGPVHVGSAAPNASPVGSAGNSLGELWVDNSLTTPGLNYYTGSAFVNLTPSGTTSTVGLVELATNAETQTGSDAVRAVTPAGLQSKVSDSISTASSTTIASATAVKTAYDLANAALPKSGGTVTGEILISPSGSLVFEGSSDDSFETTLAVVNPTADRTITLPNITGTVVTTGDTGTVTSTMIADGTIVNADINASAAIAPSKLGSGALPNDVTVSSTNIVDGTIVNADVNASAAIAGTKISPDFGGQNVVTTGSVTGASLIPSSATVPTNGLYLPAANSVALSTSGTGRLFVDASGRVGVGTSVPLHNLQVGATTSAGSQAISIMTDDSGTGELRFSDASDFNQGMIQYSHSSDYMMFQVNNLERLRITSAGLVGIGTSAPGAIFHISQTSSGSSVIGAAIRNNASTASTAVSLDLSPSSNAPGVRSAQIEAINNGGNQIALAFKTSNGDVPGTRMTLDHEGRLGIGTTSPGEKLQITGTSNTAFGVNLSSGTQAATIKFDTSGNLDINNNLARALILSTSNTERARIDSSGRLLVGTSSALSVGAYNNEVASQESTYRLQVAGVSWNQGSAAFASFQNASNVSPNISLNKSRSGTLGSFGTNALINGDDLGVIVFSGDDGAKFVPAAVVKAEVDSSTGLNDMPGRLVFSTTSDGASSPTERMRISNNGQLDTFSTGAAYAFRTASAASAASVFLLGLHSATQNYTTGTSCFVVRTNGNVENTNNSYTGISDVKLKEHIVDASSQWDDIKALQVRNYNFKPETGHQTHTQIGLVAQEVELVSPGLVSESPDRDEDGNDLGTVTKSVNYSVLYMKAVKALQEAMERIESLEARLTAAGL